MAVLVSTAGGRLRYDRPRVLEHLLTLRDFERAARAVLPPATLDYFRAGADAERTLRANLRAWRRQALWPRVLVDVATVDTRRTLLGVDLALPVIVAPMAYQKLAHAEGEIGTARAAAAAGTVFTLSTVATTSIEDVAAAAPGPKWFQLYAHRDRGLTQSLCERAEAAGYGALVVTADAPVLGRRLADERRGGFVLPEGATMANFAPYAPAGSAPADWLKSLGAAAARHDPSFGFRDLEWLASISRLPVVVKGVLRADDAARAVDHGARAIVVSNHGGRQLDGAPATRDALPYVRAAVGGRAAVLVDGGIRWGADVLKALALGADAVMLGRPVLWGLAVAGEAGARRVLDIVHAELVRAMTLAGCPSLAAIGPELLGPGAA